MATSTVEGQLEIPIKSWKYKLERVAKGYVRPTIHSDNLDELLDDWKRIHEHLAIIGERVEKLAEKDWVDNNNKLAEEK